MLYYIKEIKNGNNYRTNFVNKYRAQIKKMENISEPKLYKIITIINVLWPFIILITSIILLYCFHFSLKEIIVIVWFSIPVFLIMCWILSNNSPFFREYKNNCCNLRLKAIDGVVDEILDTPDIICKKHYIDIFQEKYSRSLFYIMSNFLQKLISMGISLYLLLLQIMTFLTGLDVSIILIITSYFIEYLHRTFLPFYADYIYEYVTEEYQHYLSKEYLIMHNITINTEYIETQNTKKSKKHTKNMSLFNNEKQLYKAYKSLYREKISYNQ